MFKYLLASIVAAIIGFTGFNAVAEDQSADKPAAEHSQCCKKMKKHSHPRDAKGAGGEEKPGDKQEAPATTQDGQPKHHFHPRDGK